MRDCRNSMGSYRERYLCVILIEYTDGSLVLPALIHYWQNIMTRRLHNLFFGANISYIEISILGNRPHSMIISIRSVLTSRNAHCVSGS